MTLRERIEKHRGQGRGRKAFWIVGATVLAVIVVGAGRGSEHHDRGFGHRAGDREALVSGGIDEFLADNGKWLERAGLSEVQAQEVAEVLERAMPEIEALRAERERFKGELVLAFEDPAGDLDRINELRREANALAVRAIDQSFYVAVDVADVLTPEQRAELVRRWREKS